MVKCGVLFEVRTEFLNTIRLQSVNYRLEWFELMIIRRMLKFVTNLLQKPVVPSRRACVSLFLKTLLHYDTSIMGEN
jgi:hypothetical protein